MPIRRHRALLAGLLAATAIVVPARAADTDHGAQVFNKCTACHAKDHTNRLGPGLEGVVGRTAGSVTGFRYSRAMRSAGIVWDDKTLDAYLTAPQKAVPGNTMPFAGLPSAADREDLIAYLGTLK